MIRAILLVSMVAFAAAAAVSGPPPQKFTFEDKKKGGWKLIVTKGTAKWNVSAICSKDSKFGLAVNVITDGDRGSDIALVSKAYKLNKGSKYTFVVPAKTLPEGDKGITLYVVNKKEGNVVAQKRFESSKSWKTATLDFTAALQGNHIFHIGVGASRGLYCADDIAVVGQLASYSPKAPRKAGVTAAKQQGPKIQPGIGGK